MTSLLISQPITIQFGDIEILFKDNCITINKIKIHSTECPNLWMTFCPPLSKKTRIVALGCGNKLNHRTVFCEDLDVDEKEIRCLIKQDQVKTLPFASLNRYPHKFDDQLRPVPCFGTTIISDLPSWLCDVASEIQTVFKTHFSASHLAFTDTSSFHMTLFDLKRCEKSELESQMKKHVSHLQEELKTKPKFEFTVVGFKDHHIILEPIDRKEVEKWRSSVGHLVSVPSRDNYEFHITLAYEVYPVKPIFPNVNNDTDEMISNILRPHIGKTVMMTPKLCWFCDMNRFVEVCVD